MSTGRRNKAFHRVSSFTISLFAICSLFIASGCGPKQTSVDSNDKKQIVLNYLERLDRKDKSLLEEINSITEEDIAVNGWKGEHEGKKGFYLQIKNLSDKIVFMHPSDYSIYSSIYENDDGKWVGISVESRPSTVIPYVLRPKEDMTLHFAFKNNLPDDINLKGDIVMPKYTNIASKGELQYSEFRIIKRFTILAKDAQP